MTQPIPASLASASARARVIRYGVVAAICLARIGASVFLKSHEAPPRGGVADFMTFYMGAKLAGTPDLYNEQAGWAVQDALVGHHSEIIPYLRLPFYGALLKPLLLLGYDRALKVWYGLLGLSLLAFVWILPLRRDVTLCAIFWSEGVGANFFLGQDTVLLLVPLALCLRLHGRGKPYLAGLALSACLIKYHFLLFLPLLIVLQRTWRFAAGFATGTLALLGISFAVQGRYWPIDYLHALARPTSQSFQNLMVDIRALFLSSPHALQIHIATSVVVAAIVILISKRAGFDLALCCCLLAGLMVSLHVYDQDYVLAIPLLCLLFTRSPWTLPVVALFSLALYTSTLAVIAMAVLLLAFVAIEGPELSLAKASTPAVAPA